MIPIAIDFEFISMNLQLKKIKFQFIVGLGIFLSCVASADTLPNLGDEYRLIALAPVNADPETTALDKESIVEDFSIHGQITYANQVKTNFSSPYVGTRSLLNNSDGDIANSYTLTATAYLGARLWSGAEVYYNPEMFQGIPFSELSGLGGFNNGELQKGASIPAIYYNARLFIRQTFGLGGEQEYVESGMNQLAGNVDKNRIVLSYGNFAAIDYFDNNKYSHDPRTQFMNWSIMASGAYDFAASTRGYTYGVVGEYFQDDWVLRAGRLAMPVLPNVLDLDYTLMHQYGDQVELTHEHHINNQAGKVKLLVFQNRGLMSTYQDAIHYGIQTSSTPDIFDTRNGEQTKWGYGINIEQALSDDIGLFARWSWNDGKTETQAFTDIGHSLSGGLIIQGATWNREKDSVGLGFAINGISSQEISYLQQGGVTMFIGDGQLNYQTEKIFEVFYSANLYKSVYLSADYQYVANPGYNADRGPVQFFGIRAHIEM